MAETYKVSYFDAKGNAEIIRLVFHAAGQDFTDERLNREEWQKIKPGSPFGGMPLLTVTKGDTKNVYCQTGAITRALATKFKLAGSTEAEEILIDEVYECVVDTQKAFYKFYFEKDDKQKEVEKVKFTEEALTKLCAYVEKRLKGKGQKGYLVGDKLSLADLALYNFVEQTSPLGFEDEWNKSSVIKEHKPKIELEKGIAESIKKRKQQEQQKQQKQ